MKSTPIDAFGDVAEPCAALARRDKALKAAVAAIGKPHIRRRPGGFEGLFRIIVEQQVSVASARAVWARCTGGFETMTPRAALAADEEGLRALGLSGPKACYVIHLADAVETGALDLAAIPSACDEDASAALQKIKGVGPWTAAIYLLFCEGRVDIWPPGDVALESAYGAACGLSGKIERAKLEARAKRWTPYRGLAAHILWTYYARLKGRAPI